MSTVLPTPAPPNRPILPPRTYGVIRSRTLMPVTNISVFDSSWSSGGAGRWIGQRSVMLRLALGTSSGSPSTLNTWPLVTSPTGTEIGAPDQAVGRLERDRPDEVVTQVLLDLEGQRAGVAAVRDVHVQREVNLRHRLGRELHVDDGADDPGDAAGAGAGRFCGVFYGRGHGLLLTPCVRFSERV